MATQQTWTRPTWTDAAQLADMIDPDHPNRPANGQPLHEWFGYLRDSGDLDAAISFLAHALPRYECVTWAAQTLIDTGAINRRDPLVISVLRWVDEPGDRMRRDAGALADLERRNTAPKLLAQAVFLSGGSLTSADLHPVQPPEDVCAKLVAAAICVGAYAQPDPQAVLNRALALGEATAQGR